jgi:hypothetical protein
MRLYGIKITIFDPWGRAQRVKHEYELETTTTK